MATPWKIRRTIDLEKWEQKAEHLGILAFTGAKNAHQMILTVFENDQPVSFTSATNVMAYFIRAGEKVTIKCSVTANVLTFRFPAAAYAIQTRVSVLVCAENTDEKVPLYAAVFDPGNGSENVIIDPDDVIPDVSKVLAQAEAAEEAAAAANQAAANAQKFADEANTAAAEATKAADDAQTATKSANAAADAADEAAVGASAWAKATMEAESLPEGSAPTISVEKNENGGNVIRVGIPTGKTGQTGETGATPQITFEVETGTAGSDVKVKQSGTAEAPHIKLTIPRGDTGAVEGVDYYTGDPAPLGTASPGTANGVARGNHVHPMPTAEQVGARPDNWMPTAEQVGAQPAGNYALKSEIPAAYTLPTATANTLGGVKSSDAVTVNADGTMTVNQLNGKNADQYALKTDLPTKASDVGALSNDGTAANSNKLGGNAPSYYMPDYGRGETLWEGNWSSGTITVPNSDRYTGFQLFMVGITSTILAMKHVNRIRGLGGFASEENSNITTYSFSASYSGDTWTFNACRGGNNERTVSKIVGLF